MTTYVSTALICSNGTILNAPSGDGTNRQVVATNSSGQLSFITLLTTDISNFPTFGSAAYVNTTAFCQVANNLSDVNATTAKSNLGLATVASTGSYNDLTGIPNLALYAMLDSPTFINNPTAPTQTAGDASTKIANTNFVTSAINTVLAAAPNKNSVKYATTAALPSSTYGNGTNGVGATITCSANGAVTVDSVILALNDELLVRNETTFSHNGLFKVTQAGDASHPLILTRRTDFDSTAEVFAGDAVYVTSGSTLAGTTWQMNTAGSITIGSSAINWTQSAGPGSYLNGTGLTLTGTTFSVNVSQTQITSIGTITTGTWNATLVSPTYGGTGVNNGTSTLTLNGNNSVGTWTASNAVGAISVDGIVLTTSSMATSGNQKYSSALHFTASGYASTPAAAMIVDYRCEVQPIQGTANPSGNLVWSYSVNGGTYTKCVEFVSGSDMRIYDPAGGGNFARLYGSSNGGGLMLNSNNVQITTDLASNVTFMASTLKIIGTVKLDTQNLSTDTTTGTKIGTAANQKIGIFGATPIVQPSGDLATGLESLGLMATSSTLATTRLSGALPVRETTVSDATSFTPNVGTTDLCYQSNSQAGGTLTINNPTGSPVDGQTLLIRLKCTNAQTLSWGTNYVTSTDLALPTTTSSGGKYDYVLFIYNGISSKYDILDKNFGH